MGEFRVEGKLIQQKFRFCQKHKSFGESKILLDIRNFDSNFNSLTFDNRIKKKKKQRKKNKLLTYGFKEVFLILPAAKQETFLNEDLFYPLLFIKNLNLTFKLVCLSSHPVSIPIYSRGLENLSWFSRFGNFYTLLSGTIGIQAFKVFYLFLE